MEMDGRKEIEKDLIKMMAKLVRTTSNCLWRLEFGRAKTSTIAMKKLLRYFLKIKNIKEKKECLKYQRNHERTKK